jgi:hypothetical protein
MIENKYSRRVEILGRVRGAPNWVPISVMTVGGALMVLLLVLVSTELG